jgi:hypothetical protein
MLRPSPDAANRLIGLPSWNAEARTFSFFLRKRDCEPVICTLAMDALENAAQTGDLSEAALNRIFDAHRLMIELRAAQKLNAGRLLEADGSVLLGADDMATRGSEFPATFAAC